MADFDITVMNCKGTGQRLFGLLISELIAAENPSSDVFKTGLARVFTGLGIDEPDPTALEIACNNLLSVTIKLVTDESRFSYVAPVIAIDIDDDYFTWQWSGSFMQLYERHRAKNDDFNIWEVAGISSKATESLMKYLSKFIPKGESGWIRISSLRRILLGKDSAGTKYKAFADLRRYVLQPCVDDIKLIWGGPLRFEMKSKEKRFTSIKFIFSEEGEEPT